MIQLNSEKFKEIEKLLESSIQNGDFESFTVFLEKEDNLFVDGFINLFEHAQKEQIFKSLGAKNINEWFANIEKYNSRMQDPRNESPPESMIPYLIWEQSKLNLTNALRNSRLTANIPQKGGVLYYLGGMSKCIVLKYEIISDYPKFEIIEIIDNPKSAFDFWGIVNSTGLREKNILKEILSTGHKLIFHRNVLMHVDRRKDIEVFGPTIDTILIAEILSQSIYETSDLNVETAIEIGCGNGLISVSLAKNCPTLKTFHSIDINFNSVICCQRNLTGNLNPFHYKKTEILLLNGSYNASIFKTKYDLMVCNPPYIPLINNDIESFISKKDYFEAVGGLSLIDDILESLSLTLSSKGRLLLLVSSLSLEYTLSKIPKNYKYDLVFKEGYEVVFDVEAVLNNEKWLEYLLKQDGLLSIQDGTYYHKLFPIWIYKND